MTKLIKQIENNVANGYGKSYATLASASKQIEKVEDKLGMNLDWLPVALESGRIAVAIHSGRSHYRDAQKQHNMGGQIASDLVHSTKGWLIFN